MLTAIITSTAQVPMTVVDMPVTIGILMYFIVGLISLSIAVIGFFCVRTLKQIDVNQSNLAEDMKLSREQLNVLQGEHNTLACRKK